jgi:hypothetical protein
MVNRAAIPARQAHEAPTRAKEVKRRADVVGIF